MTHNVEQMAAELVAVYRHLWTDHGWDVARVRGRWHAAVEAVPEAVRVAVIKRACELLGFPVGRDSGKRIIERLSGHLEQHYIDDIKGAMISHGHHCVEIVSA